MEIIWRSVYIQLLTLSVEPVAMRFIHLFKYTCTTVYIRAYAEQTVTERTDVYRSTRFFAPKMFFRSFKVTNANIETKLEQMCRIHTRLVVCAQEHNDFSGGSP